MIRVGIIGLGKMGRLRLKICRLLNDVKVVAVADSSKRALQFAENTGIKQLYNDYNDLLKLEDVNAVIISLPNFMHVESITAATETGKHVFVEKPLARTSTECEHIGNLVRRSGVKLMVGHNYRFFDCVEKVRKIYDEGVIGEAELSTLELVYDGFTPWLEPRPMPEWYFDPDKIGMWLLDAGYHLVDLFQWFFGNSEPLYAYLGHRYHLPYEDHAVIVLRSNEDLTKGILNVGWFCKMIFPQFNFRMILHGTAGFTSTDQFTPRNIYLHIVKESTKNIFRRFFGAKIEVLSYTYYYMSYLKELKNFFNSIKNDEEPAVTVNDAIKTVRTIEDIYKVAYDEYPHKR